ncbi:antA/AntB antirepressor family protein [Xanthobacter flavus]|uniref:antA/AntB antirepressor family protein n=1 Tax=Xanthobacter flavus TaxID=281 RepID=UPI003727C590
MTTNDLLTIDAESKPGIHDFDLGGRLVPTVDARELHAFLQVGRDFSNWIKDRIAQYGFEQGRDFEVFAETGENPSGGRPSKEYAITIDMAKELSMVERNEQGKKARAYFIECERVAREVKPIDAMQVLNDPAAMRGLLLSYSEKVLALEARVAEQQEDVVALERIATAEGSLCITDSAKALQVRPKDLFDYLRAHNWIYRRAGAAHDVGYQARVNAGDLEHKVTTVLRADGTEKVVEQVRVTPRGLAKLAKLMSVAAKAA